MTDQEKAALYSVVLRLVDDGQVLTPLERRDLINQVTTACGAMTADDILAATGNNRKLRVKRGTTAQNDAYTGPVGELTCDTDAHTLRLHDGQTPGGHVVAGGNISLPANMDYVVETWHADDGLSWYRKYNSGWVEQGGQSTAQTITMPVAMQDANYFISLTSDCVPTNNNVNLLGFRDKTTTGFITQGNVLNGNGASSNANSALKCWFVCGLSAQS